MAGPWCSCMVNPFGRGRVGLSPDITDGANVSSTDCCTAEHHAYSRTRSDQSARSSTPPGRYAVGVDINAAHHRADHQRLCHPLHAGRPTATTTSPSSTTRSQWSAQQGSTAWTDATQRTTIDHTASNANDRIHPGPRCDRTIATAAEQAHVRLLPPRRLTSPIESGSRLVVKRRESGPQATHHAGSARPCPSTARGRRCRRRVR
jgi:hypothetical protein